MLTIEPPPRRRRAGVTARIPSRAPVWLTATTCAQVFVQVRYAGAGTDPGIADEDAQPAGLCLGGLHGISPAPVPAHVEVPAAGQPFPGAPGDLVREGLALLVTDIAEHDAGSLRAQRLHTGGTDPAGATGDEGYPAAEIHVPGGGAGSRAHAGR